MDFVDHDFEIQGVARVGIGRLRRVTQHAHLDAAPGSAVGRKLIVAPVTARRSNYVASDGYRCSIRDEVKGG